MDPNTVLKWLKMVVAPSILSCVAHKAYTPIVRLQFIEKDLRLAHQRVWQALQENDLPTFEGAGYTTDIYNPDYPFKDGAAAARAQEE